jgi:hypothetical protein
VSVFYVTKISPYIYYIILLSIKAATLKAKVDLKMQEKRNLKTCCLFKRMFQQLVVAADGLQLIVSADGCS